jgi:eukaryotic-like serine/threonine-protein kinase
MINCWEYKKCGREPGGANSKELGICPAAVEVKVDGINRGKNGGRCCWAVAGTLCGGKIQGTFSNKAMSCLRCNFYKLTWKEEQEKDYKSPAEVIKILRGK